MSEPAREGTAQFQLIPPAENPEIPAVYSNFAQATVSPFDLTLHFGWYAIPPLMEEPPGTVEVDVRPVIKVTIPLNLVRGTIALLQRQLDAWETSFGQSAPSEPIPVERQQQP